MSGLRRLLALTLLWLLALALSGCVVVTLQADGAKPRLSAWLGGVRIERGGADAIAVQYAAIGAWEGCGAAGAGVASGWCVVIDPRGCGVAVVTVRTPEPAVPPAQRRPLTQISDQVRAECLRSQKEGDRP